MARLICVVFTVKNEVSILCIQFVLFRMLVFFIFVCLFVLSVFVCLLILRTWKTHSSGLAHEILRISRMPISQYCASLSILLPLFVGAETPYWSFVQGIPKERKQGNPHILHSTAFLRFQIVVGSPPSRVKMSVLPPGTEPINNYNPDKWFPSHRMWQRTSLDRTNKITFSFRIRKRRSLKSLAPQDVMRNNSRGISFLWSPFQDV